MERRFRKDLSSLQNIFAFVEEFGRIHRIGRGLIQSLSLAVEEIFVNMIKYNQEAKNDVLINLDVEGNTISVCLVDYDVHSFDVTQAYVVDVDRPLHEREVGGLGLHLVRKMMDDVIYEYAGRTCKIRLIKHLEA